MKKTLIVGLAILGGCLGVMGADTYAVTCPSGSLHEGQDRPSYAECNLDDEDQPDLMKTVTQIISVVVGLIGVAAVVVIVVGAVFFATSQGDAGKVARARNTILYGVIGLAVSLLAFAIVNFVLGAVFSGGGSDGNGGGESEGSETAQVSLVLEA